MSFISSTADGNDQLANLRRLIAVRWVALAAMAALTVLLPAALAIPLPTAPLLAIIGITALFNGFALWRAKRADAAAPVEVFTHLLADIAALGALVFFSGGATNPLVSLLLPPVAIAALTLPGRSVLAVGLAAVAMYSALMVFYVPLPLSDATRAARLHLLGMWLTFAISALMIAWFVVRPRRRTRSAPRAGAARRAHHGHRHACRRRRARTRDTAGYHVARHRGTRAGSATAGCGA